MFCKCSLLTDMSVIIDHVSYPSPTSADLHELFILNSTNSNFIRFLAFISIYLFITVPKAISYI